ncbi:hypothetical protein BGZ76_010494 [Entomortierella beljakovae]|nr:hypothetical protein BGZ76_010494 [Entomortierella beljakovae]
MGSNTMASAVITPERYLIIQTSTPSSNLGKIFSIRLYPIVTEYRNDDNLFWNSTTPPSSLEYEDQFTIVPDNMNRLLNDFKSATTQVNMVSSSVKDGKFETHRDLVLSYSQDQHIGERDTLIFRVIFLDPKFNEEGDQIGPTWTVSEFPSNSIIHRRSSSILRTAPGVTDQFPDKYYNSQGAAIYQLYSNFTSFMEGPQAFLVQKVEIWGDQVSSTNAPITIPYLNTSVSPKLIWISSRIYNPLQEFQGVVVGQCADSASQTCLVFFNDFGQLSLVALNVIYNARNCITEESGTIMVVSATQYWTYTFGGQTPWSNGTIGGDIPSNILACESSGNIFYAIDYDEDDNEPIISVLDTRSATWTWQRPDMSKIESDKKNVHCNNGPYPCQIDAGHKKEQLSTGAIIGIAVGVLFILGFAIYFYIRKRNGGKPLKNPLPLLDNSHLDNIPIQPYPSTSNTTNTNTNANNTTQAGQLLGVQAAPPPPRSQSWSANTPPSSSIPANTAFYTNRTSLPISSSDIPMTTFSSHPNNTSIIATSLIAAPYKPFVIPSSPLPDSENGDTPLIRSNRTLSGERQNDKAEFEAAVDAQNDNGEGSSNGGGPSTSGFNPSRHSNPLYPTPEEEAARAQSRNANRQLDNNVLSPTLANAQLILQQSQQRPTHQ